MIRLWLKGTVTARWRHLLAAGAGIACATALIGLIGVFGISSARTMTSRALSAVPVDWQVALVPGANPGELTKKLRDAAPVRAVATIGYADTVALSSKTRESTQTTGSGQVLGLPPDYQLLFPGQIRPLLGASSGVLLAQQTAANLHAMVGSIVTVASVGAAPFDVTVAGIIDLPNADALFQVIGPQRGASPTAPPDNVIMLPDPIWRTHFGEAARLAGGGARLQLHVGLDHARLPAAPDVAFATTTGMAKNFEVRAAGEAVVGDNISARLDAVRQDALLARILLLFLGLPGVVLALLLTISVVRADSVRRRHDFALLSLRGAGAAQVVSLVAVETMVVSLLAVSFGVAASIALSRLALHVDVGIYGTAAWLSVTAFAAIAVSSLAVIGPVVADLRQSSVSGRRMWLPIEHAASWERGKLDIVLLLLAALIYWRSASTGYQLVLAPEGVASTAVDYTAFLAPLLFWLGVGLVTIRLGRALLRRAGSWLPKMLSPLSGRLSTLTSSSLIRQRSRLASGMALIAIAASFAVATTVFNSTYRSQQLVDARLTTGADVAVTGTTAIPAGAALSRISTITGVLAAEPMQHRFAYVGKDLQDLFGIDPVRITNATDIVDGYFSNIGAREALARLSRQRDGILVSQETVNDFQLAIGDLLNLRMRAADGSEKTVAFHLVGVVKEFPTAPRDSFLVANARYVADQTGANQEKTVLIRADGSTAVLAQRIRESLGTSPPLKVTDISQAAHLIGSSLTAVDLATLGAVELGFAALFVAMATGLILWLGQSERTKSNAILLSLGASRREVRSFIWSETLIVAGIGLPAGALIGVIDAWMLVRLLSGVFDPPPDYLNFPLGSLSFMFVGAIAAVALSVLAQSAWTKDGIARELRS